MGNVQAAHAAQPAVALDIEEDLQNLQIAPMPLAAQQLAGDLVLSELVGLTFVENSRGLHYELVLKFFSQLSTLTPYSLKTIEEMLAVNPKLASTSIQINNIVYTTLQYHVTNSIHWLANYKETIALLIKNGADPLCVNAKGQTLLHQLFLQKTNKTRLDTFILAINQLLDLKIDPNKKCKENISAFDSLIKKNTFVVNEAQPVFQQQIHDFLFLLLATDLANCTQCFTLDENTIEKLREQKGLIITRTTDRDMPELEVQADALEEALRKHIQKRNLDSHNPQPPIP